jgi:hypothetical protein
VDPKSFGAKGRRVRCTSCKETWHQGPAEEAVAAVDPEAPLDQDTQAPAKEAAAEAKPAPAEEPKPAAEPQPAAQSEEKREPVLAGAGAKNEAVPAPESGLTEKLELPSVAAAGPNRPDADRKKAKGQSSPVFGWIALVTVVLAVLVGGVLSRDSIVRAWPPAQRLYEAAGLAAMGDAAWLRIEVVSHNHTVEDDRTFLVVRGKVTNTSGKVREVPELQAWIRGEDSRELANWTFTAAQTRLLPGETASFITRFQNPPSGGTGLAIDFAHKGS